MAPRPDASLGGVAGLAALACSAAASGVVAEGDDKAETVVVLPDAELLSLCREVAGCTRHIEKENDDAPCPWGDSNVALNASMAREEEARRTTSSLIREVVELEATLAGAVAKAHAIRPLFDTTSGFCGRALQALVDDLVAVAGNVVAGRAQHEASRSKAVGGCSAASSP